MSDLECQECYMKFASKAELANHKEHFCVESEWFDPMKVKSKLEDFSQGVANRKALSFNEVKDYLKKRTLAAGDPHVASMSLKDMRRNFQKDGKKLEELHLHITRQREIEKAEELRLLKVRQQKARAEKNKEERELRDLISKLEKQKESEIRKRMEKEMIKRELRDLDAIQLKQIENDRKQEIAKLARERAALKQKEEEMEKEVEKLEKRFTNQEKRFREEQNSVNKYFEEKMQEGNDSKKKEQMRLAQYRGKRSAELKVQRARLIDKQKDLLKRAEQMKVDIGNGIATMDVPNTCAEDLLGRDELTQIVGEVQENLGETQAKVVKLKNDIKVASRRDKEDFCTLEAELANVAKPTKESFSVQAEELMGKWISQEQLVQDESEVCPDGHNVNENYGILADTLDEIISKTAPVDNTSNNPQSKVDKLSTVKQANAPPVSPVFDAADSRSKTGQFSPPTLSRTYISQSYVPAGSREAHKKTVGEEIEELKHEYYTNDSRDPNILLQIQAIERDLQVLDSTNLASAGQVGSNNSVLNRSRNMRLPQQQLLHKQPQHSIGYTDGSQTVMMMMMMQQQQQYHQQIQLETLRRQYEDERKNMQSEMENLSRMKSDKDVKRNEYHRMMKNVLHRLDEVYVKRGNREGQSLQNDLMSHNIGHITEETMRAIKALPRDSELHRIQMKHLEEITKMRFKMQELAEKQQLFELETKLKRAEGQHRKELEHDAFMDEKRRQLRAARIQRVLAKEMPGAAIVNSFGTDYNSDEGFSVFFDFAKGIDSGHKFLRLVYCFAVGQEQKTKVRAMPPAECETESGSAQQCVIAAHRELKKVPAIAGSRCVIEIQAIRDVMPGQPGQPGQPVGWCAFDLFQGDLRLNTGLHKIPLQIGHVNFHQIDKQSIPQTRHITLFIRLCTAADSESFKTMSLDPRIASEKYSYPSQIQNIPKPVNSSTGEKRSRKPRKARTRPRAERAAAVKSIPVDVAREPSKIEMEKVEPEKKHEIKPVVELPKTLALEWESDGIGINIKSLEDCYSAVDKDTIYIRFSICDKNGTAITSNQTGNPLLFTTDQLDPVDEGADLFSFEFDKLVVISAEDIGAIEPESTFTLFEVLDNNNDVLGWNAILISSKENINKSEKELVLYECPVVFPPNEKTCIHSEQDVEARLRVELYNPKFPPDKTERKINEEAENNGKPEDPVLEEPGDQLQAVPKESINNWFIEVEKGPHPPSDPIFVPGDGFDVYLDGARYLPSCTTLSRVTLKSMTSTFKLVKLHEGKNKVADRVAITKISEDAFSPMWNNRIEYRDSTFDTTTALMIRVDVIEEGSKQIEVVGYACLNVFCEKGTRKPPTVNGEECVLNKGGHQIPIYYGPPNQKNSWDLDNLAIHDKVPCATLLIRILPAERNSSNVVMSIYDDGTSEDDLFEIAPQYSSGYYNSCSDLPSSAVPSEGERKLYKFRYELPDLMCSQRALDAKIEGEDTWETKTDKELQTWANKRMTGKPTDIMSPSRICQYNKSAGFFFRVDLAHNIKFPSAGIFSKAGEVLKVMYTLCPPGAKFLQEGNAEKTYFTRSSNWSSSYLAQEFADEKRTFHVDYKENACFVIEVKGVKIVRDKKDSSEKIQVSDLGFAILPIFQPSISEELTGHVICGLFQIPLFQGQPPKDLIEEVCSGTGPMLSILDRENSKKSKYKLQLYDNGAQLFVRILDTQLFSMRNTFLKNASERYLPAGKEKKFVYEKKKYMKDSHNISKAVPKNTAPEDFQVTINRMLAAKYDLKDAEVAGYDTASKRGNAEDKVKESKEEAQEKSENEDVEGKIKSGSRESHEVGGGEGNAEDSREEENRDKDSNSEESSDGKVD
jgi:hypothetical protein